MSFLVAYEALNCILLGTPGDMIRDGERRGGKFWTVTEDDAVVVGAAMLQPPNSLALSRMTEEALRMLADRLAADGVEVPAVQGVDDQTSAFAEHWCRLTGVSGEAQTPGHLWELVAVNDVRESPGRLGIASSDALPVLREWSVEASADFANTVEEWDEQLARAANWGGLYTWRDPEPVALAMLRRRNTDRNPGLRRLHPPRASTTRLRDVAGRRHEPSGTPKWENPMLSLH